MEIQFAGFLDLSLLSEVCVNFYGLFGPSQKINGVRILFHGSFRSLPKEIQYYKQIMKTLLYIRWQQLREVFSKPAAHTNRNYLIAFLLFILLIVLLARENIHFYLVVPAIISLFIHLSRRDRSLIAKTGLNIQIVMFTEYLLISFPFIITCLIQQLYWSTLLLLAFLSLITLLTNEYQYPKHR